MEDKDIIMDISESITSKAVKIEYLLSTAIYDADDERTIRIFSEIALHFIKKIKNNSEKIIHMLMKNKC